MQASVRSTPEQVFDGMVESSIWENSIGSYVAKGEIPFGKAVCLDDVTQVTKGDQYVDMPASAGEAGRLIGIAIADTSKEQDPDLGYGAYVANESVPVFKKGRIWVKSADTVNDLSKGVYVRRAVDAGTPATITDTTTYPVADQDTKTEKFTITGAQAGDLGEQTVTFAGATTTAAGVAAQMNAQLKQCSVAVVGGQVVVTTDEAGSTLKIANGTGTATLTWGTPVDGTGNEDELGSFRATTDGAYTQWSAAKWVAGRTQGTEYFGLLEV